MFDTERRMSLALGPLLPVQDVVACWASSPPRCASFPFQHPTAHRVVLRQVLVLRSTGSAGRVVSVRCCKSNRADPLRCVPEGPGLVGCC